MNFRGNKTNTFIEEKEKYQNKEIEKGLLNDIEKRIPKISEKELCLNSNLTLEETAIQLDVPKHILSQYLNEKLKISFSTYINRLRVEKAKVFLKTKTKFTIEGIGYESGFNSKSTFFTTFKKHTGKTPSQFKKSIDFSSNL